MDAACIVRFAMALTLRDRDAQISVAFDQFCFPILPRAPALLAGEPDEVGGVLADVSEPVIDCCFIAPVDTDRRPAFNFPVRPRAGRETQRPRQLKPNLRRTSDPDLIRHHGIGRACSSLKIKRARNRLAVGPSPPSGFCAEKP